MAEKRRTFHFPFAKTGDKMNIIDHLVCQDGMSDILRAIESPL